jgi:hypothetical protein
MVRLAVYIVRWQLSTPVLYVCMAWLPFGTLTKTIIANFIGALIFFPVDRAIMTKDKRKEGAK